MAKKKLPYQGNDGINLRNEWIKKEADKFKARNLQLDIIKNRHSKEYAIVYDQIDELNNIYNCYSDLYGDIDIDWLKKQLIKTLIQEYENRIKVEFDKRIDNARAYYTIYDYKSSKYQGTYEQYVESRAIDDLLEETSKYRYGGYMHVVIMSILTPEYREIRRKEIMEQRARVAAIKSKAIEPRAQESTQSIIERIRKNYGMDNRNGR